MIRHPRPISGWLLALAVFGLTAGGCSRTSSATPVYDPATRELVRIDYDYNADGVVDVRTYMRAGKPTRLEGDANGDGRLDRWEYYDAQGRLERVGASSQQDGKEDTWIYATGADTRMEISTQRDGRVDRREFYRADVLVRAEADTNADLRVDSWEEYDNGRLAVMAIDEGQQRGRPTRRLLYAADGSVRVETDVDGDGRFELVPPGPVEAGP
jgi:hypothetical protein